jgi:glycosyltransferase involved in cell wall biosynthesis
MLRSLVENGAEVDFFTFNTKKHFAENATIEKYFGFCKVHTVFLDAGLKPLKMLWNLLFGGSYHMERYVSKEGVDKLRELMDTHLYDGILLEGLYSVPVYIGAAGAAPIYSTPVAYRSHNLEYQIWERLATTTENPLEKWYLRIQSKRLKKYELQSWLKFQAIVPIVTTDEIAIKNYLDRTPEKSPNKNIPAIHTYQPGIAIERPFAFIHQPLSLFHIGSMEWQANEQGVMWFLHKVWPLLLSKLPQAKFHLAGKGLNPQDPRFFQTGVVNHGEVPNAEDFMHQHGVMIVPILSGSGIRIKSLEAMALGVPIVSTSVGAQGLSVASGAEMYIADQPQAFADAIVELLTQPAMAQILTQNARGYVEMHHNLKRNTAELLSFLQKLKSPTA